MWVFTILFFILSVAHFSCKNFLKAHFLKIYFDICPFGRIQKCTQRLFFLSFYFISFFNVITSDISGGRRAVCASTKAKLKARPQLENVSSSLLSCWSHLVWTHREPVPHFNRASLISVGAEEQPFIFRVVEQQVLLFLKKICVLLWWHCT